MPEIFDASELKRTDSATTEESSTIEENEVSEETEPKKRKRHVDNYSSVMREETPSQNPFDAFAAKPLQVFFDTQDSEEHIILLLRKHPFTQLRWMLIAILMALFPLVFSLVPILDFLPGRFQVAGLVLWYLMIVGFALESFLTWFFNVYIITDERVIDVDFLSLIYKNITSAKIDNIEDITAETGGAVRSVFNFGTVKIQTAGTSAQIEFEDVPQPAKVTRLLNELLLEEETEKIEGRVR